MRRLIARRIAAGALATCALLGVASAGAQAPAAPRTLDPVAVADAHRDGLAETTRRAGEAKPKIAWDPRWPRFRVSEYVATGIFVATAFASLALPPSEARWNTINPFDRAARSTLRIEGDRYREMSRDASDLLLTLMINHLATDAVLVTWWGHGRGSIAWQIAMIDIEALAFNAALNGLVAGLTSRERPYGSGCTGPEEEQTRDCRDNKRYRSFFSGHSSTAFTAAGLTCSHHANLPLYGGGAADALACGASLATAGLVAMLRVTSDQHFATDALTGAAVGALTGFGLPWLLHYRGGAPARAAARPALGVSLALAPAPLGGHLVGTF